MPKRAAALIKVLFTVRYAHTPDNGQARMNAFLKVMVAIETNHKKLATTSYLIQAPEGNFSRVHHNLIRALHRLIIEEGKDKPTFEEIKRLADSLAQRN
jgi:hypothetical protein